MVSLNILSFGSCVQKGKKRGTKKTDTKPWRPSLPATLGLNGCLTEDVIGFSFRKNDR